MIMQFDVMFVFTVWLLGFICVYVLGDLVSDPVVGI